MQNADDYFIEQFQNGNRDAFTQLVHRHKRDIFQFILSKMKNRDLASDLTQDVFVKLFKAAGLYQPTGNFRSWLFRIAQNICIDAYRKHQKATILSLHDKSQSDIELTMLDQLVDESANPANDAEFMELKHVLDQAMASLSEQHRTALVLSQYHGMSYNEIAAIQKVPVGTVKSRVHNALMKVKDYLKNRDLI